MDTLQHRNNLYHFYKLGFAFIFVMMAMVEYSTFATAQDKGAHTPTKYSNASAEKAVEQNVSVARISVKKNTSFSKNFLADEYGNCPLGTIPYVTTEQAHVVTKKRIIASGYGAPPVRSVSKGQKRLLAMRAAKLDALRTLAEQISGVHIWGGATVSDLVLVSDRVHVRLDAFIKGARVLSTHHMKDGSYEVVMEVKFNQTVLKQLEMNRCLPEEHVQNMKVSQFLP